MNRSKATSGLGVTAAEGTSMTHPSALALRRGTVDLATIALSASAMLFDMSWVQIPVYRIISHTCMTGNP
jgi:hypothetical protein